MPERRVNFKEKSVGWLVRLGKRERNSDDPLVLSVEEMFFFYVEIDLALSSNVV